MEMVVSHNADTPSLLSFFVVTLFFAFPDFLLHSVV